MLPPTAADDAPAAAIAAPDSERLASADATVEGGTPVEWWRWYPKGSGRNQRKFLILRMLSTFHEVGLTPREMATIFWTSLPESEKVDRTFEREVLRFRWAAWAMTRHEVPYLRGRRTKTGEVRYRRTKKGDRVRRKIARGSLAGRSELANYLPRLTPKQALSEIGATERPPELGATGRGEPTAS